MFKAKTIADKILFSAWGYELKWGIEEKLFWTLVCGVTATKMLNFTTCNKLKQPTLMSPHEKPQ